MIDLEQDAIALSLEHIKAQHGSSQDADANFGHVKSANFYAKCEFITKVVSKNSRAETHF